MARVSVHRILLALLYFATLAVLGYLAATGLDYYLTPIDRRPRLELYWRLKPGGSLGHPLGVAGSLMMILMLAYSLRKRLRFLRRLGPLRVWLDYHIFLGVAGPLFVILHSSFKVQGLVALSFWSMIAVASSGFVGRFLYLRIPRTQAGDELTLAQVEALDRQLSQRLREEFGLPAAAIEELETVAERPLDRVGSLSALAVRSAVDLVSFQRRLRSFRRGFAGHNPALVRRFAATVRSKAELHRRLILWRLLRRLFHYWHVFHKPFAVVMYLFMALHIAVALATGYGWRVGR